MTLSVSVEDLVMAYGAVTAVHGVTFGVREGEHVTLLGPSGCGKTTTLRAVAGLERPRSGRILLGGAPAFDGAAGINRPPERRGLSMVFQSYAIWPHMTVAGNVAFPFRVRGASRAETDAAVARALALVDLARFADRPATMLSGGQQQRVALARALAYGTKVVLLDEPLSNLDAQLRVQMRTELADLRRRLGFTALYVTHDQEEAFSLSDRILLMRGGRVEQEGSPQAVHGAPRTRFAAEFLGVRNILDAAMTAEAPGVVAARLADGTVLRAPGEPGAAIAFRPTAVTLGESEGQGGRGTVVRSLFVGDAQHVFLRSGPPSNGIEICAYARPGPGLEEGREVAWRVAPEDCLVLAE